MAQWPWPIAVGDLFALLRARTGADVKRHQLARTAFLRLVLHDTRTRALFERWAVETRIDEAILLIARRLDGLAQTAGLPSRSAFLGSSAVASAALDSGEVQAVSALQEAIAAFFQKDRRRFLHEALDFVCDDMGAPVQWAGWLAEDVLGMFQLEVLAREWGVQVKVALAAGVALGNVDPGRNRADAVTRNVEWFYRTRIQRPAETIAFLARAYRAESERRGVFQAPKDRKDITERADTKSIREGIREAERLLSLPITAHQLDAVLSVFREIAGGK